MDMNKGDEIAITGISVRYPDAKDQWEFWHNLYHEKDSIREVSEERRKLAEAPDWTDFLGEMADVDKFDHEFFDIPEEEALFLDVRHRILIETAYNALEDAGVEKDAGIARNVGVYTAVVSSPFLGQVIQYARTHSIEKIHPIALIGVLNNIASSRISHHFNFTGPSVAVDTACSGFLSALHWAAEDIKAGKIEAAVVGSVNCMEIRDIHVLAKNAGILTPNKSTRAFDEEADGSVLGEGAAVYYLEKQSEAVKNGRRVYAVIKGSAVNNDGASLGIMAPSPRGQLDVLQKAYRNAGLEPSCVSYIEAHGTGTVIGDPIEINTLAKLFAPFRKQDPTLKVGIGSVKTNIGHLLPAAASAGLTKIILSMKHKTLTASLHAENVNPALRIESTPFYLVNRREPWETKPGQRRVAGINSFGLGGANAHMIVEEGCNAHMSGAKAQNGVLVLSAKTPEALEKMTEEIRNSAGTEALSIHDIAYTRARYRRDYPFRRSEVIDASGAVTNVFEGVWPKMKGREITVEVDSDTVPRDFLVMLYSSIHETGRPSKSGVILRINKANAASHADCEVMDVEIGGSAARKELCELLAKLYVRGVEINWDILYPPGSGLFVSLPGYPFKKKVIWLGT